MFTEIDATEYLDDLWGRDGPHMHIHITKFEEVIIIWFMYKVSRGNFVSGVTS